MAAEFKESPNFTVSNLKPLRFLISHSTIHRSHLVYMAHKSKLTKSPNFRGGSFQNLIETPVMSPEVSYLKVFKDMLRRPLGIRPSETIPSVKTNLKAFDSDLPVVIWFGHSSYLIHCRGINILVDPVFSGHASPVPFMIKAFPGSDIFSIEDLPEIDFVIITHDHYDHLDKATIKRLNAGVFYTSLGVESRLRRYLGKGSMIHELDWWQDIVISESIQLTATPARHFSGRGIKRGGSLWSSFVLQLFGHRIFLGGDSGYGEHFTEIGKRFGPFDLAILECGQYNTSWPLIHMMPEETVQAGIDLRAEVLMPVHWGKFSLANHLWNEPVKRVVKASQESGIKLTTPMIGEPVILTSHYPDREWWNF